MTRHAHIDPSVFYLAGGVVGILLIHGTRDRTIRSDSAQSIHERARSSDKELVTLHSSGHVITVDSEWETVAERTYRFIQARLPMDD